MSTKPISAVDCIASGILKKIYAIDADNVSVMPFPVIDSTRFRIGDITTDSGIYFTRIKGFDSEAKYTVSVIQSGAPDSYRQEIALMIPEHSEAYTAILNQFKNKKLLILAQNQAGTWLLFGTKDQPLRLLPQSGNEQVGGSPGYDILFAGDTSEEPFFYTGAATHPGSDPQYLKTYP
jgi:hypothetical protein